MDQYLHASTSPDKKEGLMLKIHEFLTLIQQQITPTTNSNSHVADTQQESLELKNLKIGVELSKHLEEEQTILNHLLSNPVKSLYIKQKIGLHSYEMQDKWALKKKIEVREDDCHSAKLKSI
jgi:hypothetical protein